MENRRINGLWSMSLLVMAIVGVALAMVFAGCATGTNARLARSQSVFESYQGAQVQPMHRYYTTGMVNNPDAILAIANEYTLKTERWKEVTMTPDLLRQLVGRMDDEFAAVAAGLFGMEVLDKEGKRIGTWYSAVDITRVEMLSATEVKVSPPSAVEINKVRRSGRR
jgi:hypothetical protein